MKNIIIKELNNSKYDYIIFSTTVDSPFLDIDEIIKKINKSQKLTIVIDQLLQTGDNDNRFISFVIDKFMDYNSVKIVKENLQDLKKEISHYLYKNQDIMNYSILLTEQKNTIKQGGII